MPYQLSLGLPRILTARADLCDISKFTDQIHPCVNYLDCHNSWNHCTDDFLIITGISDYHSRLLKKAGIDSGSIPAIEIFVIIAHRY